jgi:hypothetical protein
MTKKDEGIDAKHHPKLESYRVHAIVNRRFNAELNRLEYLVMWVDYQEGTWEPEASLCDQGFEVYCRLVDRWFTRTPEDISFSQFCRSLRLPTYLAADHDGRCAFDAVKIALAQLNNSTWYSDVLVDDFYQKHLERGVPIPNSSLPTWKLLRDFIYFGNQRCRLPSKQIFLKAFSKNELTRTITSAEDLDSVILADGSYICAAFNPQHVGHAFAVAVSGGIKLASDQDRCNQPLADFVKPWFFRTLFIRRVELFLKR